MFKRKNGIKLFKQECETARIKDQNTVMLKALKDIVRNEESNIVSKTRAIEALTKVALIEKEAQHLKTLFDKEKKVDGVDCFWE